MWRCGSDIEEKEAQAERDKNASAVVRMCQRIQHIVYGGMWILPLDSGLTRGYDRYCSVLATGSAVRTLKSNTNSKEQKLWASQKKMFLGSIHFRKSVET